MGTEMDHNVLWGMRAFWQCLQEPCVLMYFKGCHYRFVVLLAIA